MTILRYNTISSLPDVMFIQDYEFCTAEKSGDYCIDTSHFVPKSEALASFRRAGDIANSGFYDFPDGKDTGAKLPFVRSADYHGDIAELSHETRVAQENVKSSIDKAKIAFEREQILNSVDSFASTSTASTGTASAGE